MLKQLYSFFIGFIFLLLTSTNYAQKVRAYGDSFTHSAGATSVSNYWTSVLSRLWNVQVEELGIGAQTATTIINRLIADSARKSYPTIIWAGNVGILDTATIIRELGRGVKSLGHDKFLIVGVINSSYQAKPTSAYNTIAALNKRLSEIYTYHYVPVRETVVAAYNPKLYYDSVCHAKDFAPLSLRYDSVHYNDSGYALAARKIAEYHAVFGITLPLYPTSLTANLLANNHVEVAWTMGNEDSVSKYEVEKSVDSVHFNFLKTVTPTDDADKKYSVFDNLPYFQGNNYYRIKSTSKSGKINYSKTVKVYVKETKSKIEIYPNPVQGGSFNLQLTNKPKGIYSITIINSFGQTTFKTMINHSGENLIYPIRWKSNIGPGIYQIIIEDSSQRDMVKLLIE